MSHKSKMSSVRHYQRKYGTTPPWLAYGLDAVRSPSTRLTAKRPNTEGLTFEEWMLAAAPALGNRVPAYPTLKTLRESPVFRRYVEPWRRGEDPTEWRASC